MYNQVAELYNHPGAHKADLLGTRRGQKSASSSVGAHPEAAALARELGDRG